MLGPASVPEVTDLEEAAREIELTVLSAVAHGNGPNGVAVVKAALFALERLDREHAAVYFQILWNGLRAPMQRALEAMVMERQTEGSAKFPPFMEALFERARHESELKGRREGELEGRREGELEGRREGELDGLRQGKVDGLREALLRLIGRTGIALSGGERARVQTCDDPATLEQWIENVLTAKTAADILS